MATARKCGAENVAVHVGGAAPGVSHDEQPSGLSRVKNSVWYPVLSKALSITAGMLGLAAIGVVAGAPRGEHVEMSMAAALDNTWLAGAGNTSSSAAASNSATPSGTTTSATAEESKLSSPTVPASGTAGSPAAPNADQPAASSGLTADGKVILNSAGIDDLMRLPGIGKKRAENILALRERLRRFKSPSDLLRVKGIGPKSLRKMLPHLVLDAPTPVGSGGAAASN